MFSTIIMHYKIVFLSQKFGDSAEKHLNISSNIKLVLFGAAEITEYVLAFLNEKKTRSIFSNSE